MILEKGKKIKQQKKLRMPGRSFTSRQNPDGTCLIKMNVYQKPAKKCYSIRFHITKENRKNGMFLKMKNNQTKPSYTYLILIILFTD